MRTPIDQLKREALALLVRSGDASDLTLFLLGMAAVAGMLLTIGACA